MDWDLPIPEEPEGTMSWSTLLEFLTNPLTEVVEQPVLELEPITPLSQIIEQPQYQPEGEVAEPMLVEPSPELVVTPMVPVLAQEQREFLISHQGIQ